MCVLPVHSYKVTVNCVADFINFQMANARSQYSIFVIYLSANKRVGSSDKFQYNQPVLYSTQFQWNYRIDDNVDGILEIEL